MRYTICNKPYPFIYFVDDVEFIGKTFQAAFDQYTKLNREAENVELKENASNTKLLTERAELDKARIGSRVTIDGNKFAVTDKFYTLHRWLRRIATAADKFGDASLPKVVLTRGSTKP